MVLDPTWVGGILVALEAGAGRQAVQSFRARSRFPDRRDDVRQSKSDGYAGRVTQSLSAMTQRVIDVRVPERTDEDGTTPAQAIGDVLARADVHEEIEAVIDAFEDAVNARRCARRCRQVHRGLGGTLVSTMLLMPVPFWPYVADAYILTGTWLHVTNTLLAVTSLASLGLFAGTISAEGALTEALLAQKPDHVRIGS